MSRHFPELGGRCAYDILEISPEASEDEIRAAHHRLARRHHPDLNQGNVEAATAFTTLLNNARDVLLHDRAAYDAERLSGAAAAPSAPRWTPPSTPRPPRPSRPPRRAGAPPRAGGSEPPRAPWERGEPPHFEPPHFEPPRFGPFAGAAPAGSGSRIPRPEPRAERAGPRRNVRRRGRRRVWAWERGREGVPLLARVRRAEPSARWEAPVFGLLSLSVVTALAVAVLRPPWAGPGRPSAVAAAPVARAEVPLPYQGRWNGKGPGSGELELVIVAGQGASRSVYGWCSAALTPVGRTDTSITFLEQAAKGCKGRVIRVVARHEGELETSFCDDEACREVTWSGKVVRR